MNPQKVILLCHDSLGFGAKGVVEFHEYDHYHTIKYFDKIGVQQPPKDIHFECLAKYLRRDAPKMAYLIKGVEGMREVVFNN